MRNYIILHGLNESLNQYWGTYLEKEIKLMGGRAYIPEFPKGKETSYDSWEKAADELYEKGILNEETVVITHSLSTNFMITYLEKKQLKINAFIAIAGYSELVEKDVERKSSINKIISPFLNTTEDRKKFVKYAKHRYAVYSNKDRFFCEPNLEKYAIDIKANRTVMGSGGHFDPTNKLKELPLVMDIIKEIESKNRKSDGRVVYVGQEEGATEATIKKYKEVKEYLASKFRYVTTPLRGIEHKGVELGKFKKYTTLIKESDLVIIDISNASIDVGIEMMMAISMEIPTLVVAKSTANISSLVQCAWGNSNIKKYKNTQELITIIETRLN